MEHGRKSNIGNPKSETNVRRNGFRVKKQDPGGLGGRGESETEMDTNFIASFGWKGALLMGRVPGRRAKRSGRPVCSGLIVCMHSITDEGKT